MNTGDSELDRSELPSFLLVLTVVVCDSSGDLNRGVVE